MSLALSSLSHCRSSRLPRVSSASLDAGLPRATSAKILPVTSPRVEETPERIAKAFETKNEISISTYDTAWVAMVPSPFSSTEPCFSDSLDWLLENQCHDGSWARPHHHSLLKKDVLSSTLASVLALKKWGVGQQHIDKGLHFVESNFGCAADESLITPTGFEIIFPAMLDRARALSLNPVLEQTTLNHVMSLRDLELKRIYSSTDKEAYMAYIGEGLTIESTDVMKYQRKNGSLFDSPSSTAAAFTASGNSGCLSYLNLVVSEFGGAVPAVYPLDIYPKLRAIDNLEKWGISRYFTLEIRSMLDQAYRCWMQGDEEIFKDASTCALAFKILRKNGYNVTSDDITKLIQEQFPTNARGLMADINTTLELFRASEHMLYPHETELEKQNSRLRSILEHELSSASIKSPRLKAEKRIKFNETNGVYDKLFSQVKHALDFPFYAILERMATRKNIEHFDNFDDTRMLKTSYCLPNLGSKDLLLRSVEDFNRCQAMHREEFIEFERWFVEHRLDQVDLAMNKFVYCYFTAAATFFAPELSDARMSWAKNAVMIAVTDDLYDVKGSYEEKKQLIELLRIWDVDMSTVACSKDVEIIFLALKSIVVELDEKGSNLQGRSLTAEGINIWVECLNAYMQEVEWGKVKYVPTFDEYLENAYVSFGLGPIVKIPVYLVGPKISEEMVNHPEYHDLFKLMSTCGRLVNDIHGYERESQQGKVSGVALYIAQYGGGEMSTEAAVTEILSSVDAHRRQLLGLVSDNCTVIPKAIKELYWHMATVNELFFKKDDGFWSKELTHVAHHIVQEPIAVDDYNETKLVS